MSGARVELDKRAIKRISREAADKATAKAAATTARRVRSLITSTGRVDTGAMRRSIKVRDNGPYEKEVYSTLPYTDWQNDGTDPYVIRPKNPKGLLVFYWAKAGRVVALRQVNHPGIEGAKFYESALDRLTLQDFLT